MDSQGKTMPKSRSMFSGTGPQIIAAFTATVSAISDGMHYGWTAPVLPILRRNATTPVPITPSDEYWLETIYLMGGMAGLPVTIYLVTKIGRKHSTIAATLTSLLSWLLIALARRTHLLYIARFLAGLAGDVAFVATPMYVAEIADQQIRGFLSSLIYLMMLFGILLVYCIAPFVPFYVPSLVGAALLLLQLALAARFMPQSPYYLLSKHRLGAARGALDQLRSGEDNEEELQRIRAGIDREARERARPLDLLLVKSNRKATLIVGGLNVTQHFVGFSVLLMNLHTILAAAGSIFFAETTSAILFSVIMFATATLASFYVDKYGRKVLLTSSAVCTGVCMLALAVYFHLKHLGRDVAPVSWVPVACVMVYAAVFKWGLGMVPIVLSAELFSNRIKAVGMAAADLMYLVFAFCSIQFYEVLKERYGYHVPFYVFGGVAFAGAVFTSLYIVETKGRTLDEIQVLLRGEEERSNDKELEALA